jgi:hypothetical protein
MQQLLKKGERLAKQCILCDGPAHEVTLYGASLEQFVRWRVRGLVYALCRKCLANPASKERVLEEFERLAQRWNADTLAGLQ